MSNRLLAILLLLMAINLIDVLAVIQELLSKFASIALIDDGFLLAFGPLLYFYVQSLIYEEYQLQKKDWLHLLPFILLTIFLGIVPYIVTNEQGNQQLEAIYNFSLPWQINAFMIGLHAHIMIYLGLIIRQKNNYRSFLKEKYTDLKNSHFPWLNFIINSFIGIEVVAFLFALVPLTLLKPYFEIFVILFIGYIFYFSNRFLLTVMNTPEIVPGMLPRQLPKYASSNLKKEDKEQLQEKLKELMEEKKVYLNADLNIDALATQLGTTSKKTSQVINETYQKNFFDYINTYRIEEAKKILTKPGNEKLTVLEIVYQTGFNSKSSFNTFFKKSTGLTPTQYKRSNSLLNKK